MAEARPFSGHPTILESLPLCHRAIIMLGRRQAGHDVSYVSACNTLKVEALESNELSVPICWESDRSENSSPEDWLALVRANIRSRIPLCGPVVVISGLQSPRCIVVRVYGLVGNRSAETNSRTVFLRSAGSGTQLAPRSRFHPRQSYTALDSDASRCSTCTAQGSSIMARC